jgi:hypothetical protein
MVILSRCFSLLLCASKEQLRSSDIEKLEVCPTFARFHFGGEGSSLADFAAITNDDDLLMYVCRDV